MAGTLHIFLDSPARTTSVGAEDRVVDHRVDRGSALDSGDVDVVVTDVTDREHHDRARDAFLEWVATVGDRELRVGGTLKTLLAYRESLSLWWFLPLQVKHYVLHPLPKLFQQIAWLRSQSSTVLEQLVDDGVRSVRIYSKSRAGGELFEAAFRGRLTRSGLVTEVVDPNGSPHDSGPKRSSVAERAERLAQPLAPVGFKALGLWRRLTERSGDEPTCDVAIVTSADEWYEPGGVPEHRYLTDTPRRLASMGLRVAWLPLMTGADQWPEFREILEGRDEPTLWPRAEWLSDAAGVAQRGVAEVRGRYEAARSRLREDPALAWEGLDLSEWIVAELDEFLRARAFFWMQAHELLRRRLERTKPAVVLYRNEFYSLQRTVGAAATLTGTPGWAYQHGAIPRTHWVYQHDGRDVRSDGDLVAGMPAPDLFLTYSDFVTELVTAKDYPRERVATLGSLRHDVSFERANAEAGAGPGGEGDDGGLTIVICTQLKSTIPAWIRLVVEGLQDANIEGQVVVKPHWNHRDDHAARATFRELGWDDYRIYDGELDPMLAAADVCVTGTSTTAMEAGIAGTPVICVQDEMTWEPTPYVEGGLAQPASDRASMAQALRTIASESFRESWPDRRRRFLENQMNNIIEPAVEALGRRIERLLEAEPSR